jgi:hypothetical protein
MVIIAQKIIIAIMMDITVVKSYSLFVLHYYTIHPEKCTAFFRVVSFADNRRLNGGGEAVNANICGIAVDISIICFF